MRTRGIVVSLAVAAAGLFLQVGAAQAQEPTKAIGVQKAPITTPLLQAIEAAAKPDVTKTARPSHVNFHGRSQNGRSLAVAGGCDIYCANGQSIGVPADTIEDCACACTSFCGVDSCTDLDTGLLYFC